MAEKELAYGMYVQFHEDVDGAPVLRTYHKRRTGAVPGPHTYIEMTIGGRSFNFVVQSAKMQFDNDGVRGNPWAILVHSPRERETTYWLHMSLKNDRDNWQQVPRGPQ